MSSRPVAAAFTLIELLVVVSVIAILAAIALPNFLEAQTRAKVSAAKASLRVVAGGLEMYYVDHSAFPPSVPLVPEDPLGLLADQQLRALTTPIAYVAGKTFRDPFGTPKLYSLFDTSSNPGGNLFPPNRNQALLYFNYASTAERLNDPNFLIGSCAVVCIGPDQEDSLGAFSTLPPAVFRAAFVYARLPNPIDTIYDPTNGTVSMGDVVRLRDQGMQPQG